MTRRNLSFWIMFVILIGSTYISDIFDITWFVFVIAIPIIIFISISIINDPLAAWLNKKVGSHE